MSILKGKHLVIAVPTYDGKVPVQWIKLFGDLYALKRAHGFQISFYYYANGALITNVRNMAVQEMMSIPDATHLLFIDADILFDPEDVVRMLAKCSLGTYDLVAGVYPIKQDHPQFQLEAIGELKDATQDEYGLIEIKGIGTGFMMMKRKVLEKMIEAYPELEYTYKGKKHYALFHQAMDGSRYMGEDISFCLRWKLIGGRLWADPSVKLKHIGMKIYDYNILELMKEDS